MFGLLKASFSAYQPVTDGRLLLSVLSALLLKVQVEKTWQVVGCAPVARSNRLRGNKGTF